MNTNVTKKNFFMNDIDGEFYEIEQYTLTMHKICTMWAEYNLVKWKCLSPCTHSHTQTLSFDRFSNAVHWFHLRWCCCYCCFCLPFSDVRVNLAWESKQWVTEVIYSVHRPIDTEKWHKVWMKTNKNVTRSVSHFFSLLFFLEKGRLGRRTLVILGSSHKQ